MRFTNRLFLALFIPMVALLFVAAIYADRVISANLHNQYLIRYRSLGRVIASAMKEMDLTVDKVSQNAISVLYQIEKLKGLPTSEDLRILANDLHVSHFYITDDTGKFIRHTDLPAELLPYKLFDFCAEYRQLLTGGTSLQQTSIIPSNPYTGPYKFTMIPNHNKTRVLEVGYHMKFIADTLLEVVRSDKNIQSIGLFSPSGFELGSISSDGKLTHGQIIDLRELSQEEVKLDAKNLVLNTQIPAGTKNCCECRVKKISTASGEYFYLLRAHVSLQPFLDDLAGLRRGLLALLSVLVLISGVVAIFLSRLLVRELNVINSGVEAIMRTNDLGAKIQVKGALEFISLADSFNRMVSKLAESQKNAVDRERNQALVQMASQVAHDIRSPLAAMSSLEKDLVVLPEDKRLMIRGALNRIRDIANNLLDKNRQIKAFNETGVSMPGIGSGVKTEEQVSSQLLSSLLEPLITEKRLQYRSMIDIEIDGRVDASAYGLFSKIQPTEFKRVVSNLINNAVEALGEKGLVTLSLLGNGAEIEVTVRDNGKGISPAVLAKIGQRGETHGKAGGSGLGLFHARTAVESWSGQLRIGSEVGVGTSVTLVLPQVPAPQWFVSELKLIPGSSVVVLDDDTSIHQIWQGRWESLRVVEKNISIVHLSTPEQFRNWVRDNSAAAASALYLADYELIGFQETGLSLIDEHGIGSQSILVTSRFEEHQILEGCQRLKVRMIPKGMAGFVPISFGAAREFADAILIDDDSLVISTWSLVAKQNGKKLLAYAEPASFFVALESLDRSTPVFIDSNLGKDLKGQDLVPRVLAMGFKLIYLATGYEAEAFAGVSGLAGVVGKNPPAQIGGRSLD